MKKLLTIIMLILLLGPFLFLTGCTNPSIPAGHEGYVKENPRVWGKGGFRGALKGPANYGVMRLRMLIFVHKPMLRHLAYLLKMS